MISCLLFMIQGIGSFILLKDTTGKAGFDLFSDLSELTFILVLLAFLFYNALYSFEIMRNSNTLSEGEKVGKLGFVLYCWSSFLALTITVIASFCFSDVMRCCVSLFCTSKDNFSRLSIYNVLRMNNLIKYCLSGPLYLKINLIGGLVVVSNLLSLCGFVFQRNVLIKTFMMVLLCGVIVTGIFMSDALHMCFGTWNPSNEITLCYICFYIELFVALTAHSICYLLYKRSFNHL